MYQGVYQANETGVRHELSEEPVVVARLPVRRGGRGRGRGISYARLRAVRLPAGFTYVEDGPAAKRVRAGLGRLGAAGAWSEPVRTGPDLVLHTVVLAYRPIERAGGVLHLRG